MGMVQELFCLSLFLISALAGVARFRHHQSLDRASLMVSHLAIAAGTLLLTISTIHDHEPAFLIPLSLLILMHGMTFLFDNSFTQIMSLPLVIGEMLLSFMFVEIRELFANPATLTIALFFHMAFIGMVFKLVLALDTTQYRGEARWSPYALAFKLDRHRDQLKTLG